MACYTANNDIMSSNYYSDVPTYIEFTPQDILDYASSDSDGSSDDCYNDLLSLSYSDDDDMSLTYDAGPSHAQREDDGYCAPRWPHHQEAHQDAYQEIRQDAHQAVGGDGSSSNITDQDLDAMKQMIHEMLANPELLHRSPVYTKATAATTTHSSGNLSSPSALPYSSRGSSPSSSPQLRSPLSRGSPTYVSAYTSHQAEQTMMLYPANISGRVEQSARTLYVYDTQGITSPSCLKPSKVLQRRELYSQSVGYCQECSPQQKQQQVTTGSRVNVGKLMGAIPALPFC